MKIGRIWRWRREKVLRGMGGEIGGVALREWRCHGSSIRMTEVSILNEKGAESMGKADGNLPDDGDRCCARQ